MTITGLIWGESPCCKAPPVSKEITDGDKIDVFAECSLCRKKYVEIQGETIVE